jgi:hypothetical protein
VEEEVRNDFLELDPCRENATPQAGIAYELPRPDRLSIGIHDVRGRLVRTLIDEVPEELVGKVVWDRHNDRAAPWPRACTSG